MPASNIVAEPNSLEIVLTRVFDVPREMVFKAYTDPDMVRQWWGQRDNTMTLDVMDVKPGGLWRYIETDPNGNEYAFHGVYHEIVSPERVVQTFEFEGTPGHVVLSTVRFVEQDGKTKVIDQSVFQSVEDRDGMLQSGMAAGASESMDRLAELLAKY